RHAPRLTSCRSLNRRATAMPQSDITSYSTRGKSGGAAGVGAIFMAIGHALIEQVSAVKWLFLIGALFLCLKIAGPIDPPPAAGLHPGREESVPPVGARDEHRCGGARIRPRHR